MCQAPARSLLHTPPCNALLASPPGSGLRVESVRCRRVCGPPLLDAAMAPKRSRKKNPAGSGKEPLIKLKPTTKNRKKRVQPSPKRPRVSQNCDDNESEGDSSHDFQDPICGQRTEEAERASKRLAKSTASKAKKNASASICDGALGRSTKEAAGGSSSRPQTRSIRERPVKQDDSVFGRRVRQRKRDREDGSADSDTPGNAGGRRDDEVGSRSNREVTVRRVSPRKRNSMKLGLNPPGEERKSVSQPRRASALLKSDASADDSTQSGDLSPGLVDGDEAKTQSQTGSQLQLTVRAIVRPKSRSRDALDKKQQAYERVKQERLSEIEMAFIREEFCVHYPPPPSNMAAAGRYELANRREMTKEMRDALWKSELKPWSDRWWMLYGMFTDFVRAEKMKKPLTSSTDVRRGECKMWSKSFRSQHGDARPQSSRDKVSSDKALAKLEGQLGATENAPVDPKNPAVDTGEKVGKIANSKHVKEEQARPTDASDSSSDGWSKSDKSNGDASDVDDSENNFSFGSCSEEGHVGVPRSEGDDVAMNSNSFSDRGHVGIPPSTCDDLPMDGATNPDAELIPTPVDIAQTSLESGMNVAKVKMLSPVPVRSSPRLKQASTQGKNIHAPICAESKPCAADITPATAKVDQDEDTELVMPLAGSRDVAKLVARKVGECGVGTARIPKKKVQVLPFAGKPTDELKNAGPPQDSRSYGTLSNTGAVTLPQSASRSQGDSGVYPVPQRVPPSASTGVVAVSGNSSFRPELSQVPRKIDQAVSHECIPEQNTVAPNALAGSGQPFPPEESSPLPPKIDQGVTPERSPEQDTVAPNALAGSSQSSFPPKELSTPSKLDQGVAPECSPEQDAEAPNVRAGSGQSFFLPEELSTRLEIDSGVAPE